MNQVGEVGEGTRSACTVGVLFPERFHTGGSTFRDAMHQLGVCAPEADVVVMPYEDTSERRTRRSRPDHRRADDDVDDLTDRQLEVYARMDVALALDLPYDIARIAPRLRWVQAVGSGVGQLASSGVPSPQIRLTSAAGTSAPEIAEFVMARVLEHATRLRRLDELQAAHTWRPVYGAPVGGTTIGLIGLGSINLEVARLASAFGMRVIGVRRRPGAPPAHVDEVHPIGALAEVAARCDVVVAALPETAATAGVFDAAFFAAMRPGSLFCNVGRGTAVDDEALLAALRAGAPGAAALDVFTEEPLAPDHPYWDAPGLRVSAHCSSVPSRSIDRVHELFRDNLGRFLAGEPLHNEVSLAGTTTERTTGGT